MGRPGHPLRDVERRGAGGVMTELGGSFAPTVVVDSWYDGDLTFAGLPLVEGTLTFDLCRTVTGSLTATFAGPEPELDPLSAWGAPLAPWGSELHVSVGLSASPAAPLLSMGWFVVVASDPTDYWGRYDRGPGQPTQWVSRGTQVEIEAADRMLLVDDAAMYVPELPAQLASVRTEIGRLVNGLVPVGDLSAVADAAIPRDFAYSKSRTEGLQALAAVLAASPRMDENGALILAPDADPVAPAAVLSVGETAVSWSRRISRDDIYNRVVAIGEGNVPVWAVADESAGALRWNGPLRRRPVSTTSQLIATKAQAQAVATATLAAQVRSRVIAVQVRAAANPALKVGDLATIVQPQRTFTGQVQTIQLKLPLSTMDIGMAVPAEQLTGQTVVVA